MNFPSLLSNSRGTEQRVSQCTLKSELMTLCQDACEGFGSQEESKVVTVLNGVFTLSVRHALRLLPGDD